MKIEIKNCGAYSILGYLGLRTPEELDLKNINELTINAHFIKGVDIVEEVDSLKKHFPHIKFKIIVC